MADSTKDRGEPDRSRISLSQAHEIRYWTEQFGVTEAQLRTAVELTGNSTDEVRRFLNRR